MPWQPDDAAVVAEVLAAELRADAEGLRQLEDLLLHLDVAEPVTGAVTGCRQRVEVVRARILRRLDCELRTRAADDGREVIRGARGGAERPQLLVEKRQHALLIEHRFGLLIEVGLVCAAAALCHEQELVRIVMPMRVSGVDLDLGRQVVARVALVPHRQRRHLRVAQVQRRVGVVDATGQVLLVAAVSQHMPAALGTHDGRTCVLAHRQNPAGGDVGVLQQVEGHETVVGRSIRVVEDPTQLGQVARPQQVGDGAHGGAGKQRERLALHLQEPAAGGVDDPYAVGGQQPIRRLVRAQRQQLGEGEVGHDPRVRRKVPRVSATESDRRGGPLALEVLVGAASLRILAAVIAGVIALGQHDDLNIGRQHAGEVLNAFGAAGDSIRALLAAGAAALVWLLSRQTPVSRGVLSTLRAVVVVTALMAVARATAIVVLDIDHIGYELTIVIGFAIADVLLCAGILLVLSRLRPVDLDEVDPDDVEPLLFAVDRGNGEVFAFFSLAQARRSISPYSIEENEFTFYTDEGMVVEATATDLVTHFTPTGEDRREDLMRALRRFAQVTDLTVEEPQEPTSYAVPISDWQWLELWPGWLRPIGRIVRRLQT